MGFIQVDPQSIKIDSTSPSVALGGLPPVVSDTTPPPKGPDNPQGGGFVEVDPKDIQLDAPPDTRSIAERFAKGTVEGIGQAGVGMMQAATELVAPTGGVNALTGDLGGTKKLLKDTVDSSRARSEDLGTAGKVGELTGMVAVSLPAALAVGPESIAGSATLGAAQGAIQPVGTGDSRLANATIGGVTGGALHGVVAAPGAISKAVTPVVAKDVAPLAARAQELGIPLSVTQVAPSKVLNTAQKASQVLPFSGVQAFEDTQRQAWNGAVAKTLGPDVKDLTPESISKFTERNSGDFDRILTGKDVKLDDKGLQGLYDISKNAGEYLDKDAAQIVQNKVNYVLDNVGPNGVIDGQKLAALRSSLLKNAKNANGGAANYLGDLTEHVDDIAAGGLSPEDAQALGQVRRQYRNLKTIQPLLEKSTNGQINPTELINRVGASKYITASKASTGDDDLVDLARIGKQFLGKLGGSDTYDKAALVGGLGTAVLNPGATAVGAAGLAANRGLQAANQSQRIVGRLVGKALRDAPNPAAKPSAVEALAEDAGQKITRTPMRDAPNPKDKPLRIDIGKRGSK